MGSSVEASGLGEVEGERQKADDPSLRDFSRELWLPLPPSGSPSLEAAGWTRGLLWS